MTERTVLVDLSQRLSPERQNEILEYAESQTRAIFSSKEMPFLPVHDITHVERVVRNTKLICAGEGVDPFFPLVAAWLHDIGRLQELQAKEKGTRVFHAEESAKQVPLILDPFSVDIGEAIELIKDAVARHSLKNAEDDSLLARILKDADRLDGIGAIGLPRVFAFYPERPIYNPTTPFSNKGTSEEYLRYSGQSTQIEAFFRNMEWFPWLRVKTAIKLGIPKIQLMISSLYQLADELGVSREQVASLQVVQDIEEKIRDFNV